MGENNNSGASLGRRQPGTPQCPPQRPSLLPSVPQTLCKVGHMAISALPPPPTPSRPAPRVLFCLRPLARARPPSVEDRKEAIPARARACRGPPKRPAEGCGAGRRGEAGGGQRRSGAMQLASHTRPPAPLTRAHSREERTLARVPHRHSPKETEGRTETRRTRLRQSRATVAQPRTATPGTARRDFLTHSRSSPREPQQAREENAHCAPAAII